MNLIATSEKKVVIGLGATGQSVVRFLLRQGISPVVVDSREAPPALEQFRIEYPDVAVECGPLNPDTLRAASEIIVSPGVGIAEPAIAAAMDEGVPVVGDIELFARELNRLEESPKVIAITGSNGKSTVTTLMGEMVSAAGFNVEVGGNIGVPVLDLLAQCESNMPDVFVLELSSFQLETTYSLAPDVATILNMSADHMDRYPSMAAYHQAKQRVYRHAQQLVINRADPLTRGPLGKDRVEWSFGLDRPDLRQFGIIRDGAGQWLAQGTEKLLRTDEMAMVGSHNIANALAALALGNAVGMEMPAMLQVLRHFSGLTHRCERVGDMDGVVFVNDSKGTNVGATRAALDGLADDEHKIVLIAGGDGKGADFSPLGEVVSALRGLVTIGVDGPKIASVFADGVPQVAASDMADAVTKARAMAQSGDFVLLSPACASFDMYRNFEARGEDFRQAVEELVTGGGADREALQ
ncbi:UDP-N-acetylmuramoyl-L-alanine--D-glutamate ligase [Microbulbifer agarilyticus]|uniref:UDP-N-acetylmuramoyl-L-alanine--D-glutamate ligase n=1 Tax=Microbulbifer agarilyticus TaxID=260552 RepID=UPI001C952871|nr:UDP-N-acetylmuramoyl-L-alanine--D-glutamate ligase [Microbulbifer agarilyticus]MBY6212636.1 UDP-N-acetylmuramoyl-L-alanine--D-glutamate ligase [Microbulbifer agarilyticus]